MRNAIRRVAIDSSGGSDWGFRGYEFEDPDTGATVCEGEGDPGVPVFQGIGIYARPSGEGAEAIMLHVGTEADHPLLASVRDEDGRRAYVSEHGEIAAGEVAIYNGDGRGRVLVRADGSIEITSEIGIAIKSKAGIAEPGIKGTTYRTAEDLLFAALAALGTAIGADAALAPLTKAAGTAMAAAVTTFTAAAATYLTTKTTHE